MTWFDPIANTLWTHVWTVLPVAGGAALASRWYAGQPAMRHAAWLVVLAWFGLAPLLPTSPSIQWLALHDGQRDEEADVTLATRSGSGEVEFSSDLAVDAVDPARASDTVVARRDQAMDADRESDGDVLREETERRTASSRERAPGRNREVATPAPMVSPVPRPARRATWPGVWRLDDPAASADRGGVASADARRGQASADPEEPACVDPGALIEPELQEQVGDDPSALDAASVDSAACPQPGSGALADETEQVSGARQTSSEASEAATVAAPVETAAPRPAVTPGGHDPESRSEVARPLAGWWVSPVRDLAVTCRAVFQAARTMFRQMPAIPATLWLAGMAAVIFWTLLRMFVFGCRLRRARPADARVRRDVRLVARRLRLRRIPEVRMLDTHVSPLVWCGLRPRLILPVRLWEQLDRTGRRAILCHELAHLRRRDHWVRWLELLTSALYWWHPVVWWVRRRLAAEADACCDNWVVWLMPRERRAYAQALLQTRQFIDTRDASAGAAAMAVTTSDGKRLARRLTMVMTQTAKPRGRLMGISLMVLLLTGGWLVAPALSSPPEARVVDRGVAIAGGGSGQAQVVVAGEAVCADGKAEHVCATSGHKHSCEAEHEAHHKHLAEARALSQRGYAPAAVLKGGRQAPAQIAVQGPAPTLFAAKETVRTYTLPARKRELLVALMAREDVPVRIRVLDNGIEVRGTEAEHAAVAGFVALIHPESERWEVYTLPQGKLEALSELMVLEEVPVLVSPEKDRIRVRGTDLQHQAFAAFVKAIDSPKHSKKLRQFFGGEAFAPPAQQRKALDELHAKLRQREAEMRAQIEQHEVQSRALRHRAEAMRRHAEERASALEQLSQQLEKLEQAYEADDESLSRQERREHRAKLRALERQQRAVERESERLQEHADQVDDEAETIDNVVAELEEHLEALVDELHEEVLALADDDLNDYQVAYEAYTAAQSQRRAPSGVEDVVAQALSEAATALRESAGRDAQRALRESATALRGAWREELSRGLRERGGEAAAEGELLAEMIMEQVAGHLEEVAAGVIAESMARAAAALERSASRLEGAVAPAPPAPPSPSSPPAAPAPPAAPKPPRRVPPTTR